MTNANVIEMNEVTKAFDRVTALNRCSLKVKRGRDLRVSGAIRRGQDYYIKTADRAAPQRRRRDGGAGENPFSPKMKQRIGIMSDMSGLYEKMTVYENLEIFCGHLRC